MAGWRPVQPFLAIDAALRTQLDLISANNLVLWLTHLYVLTDPEMPSRILCGSPS